MITKQMSVSEVLSKNPLARSILKKYGISFIGKELSPLESIEKVAMGNGLSRDDIDKMIIELNTGNMEFSPEGVIYLTETAARNLKKFLDEKGKKAFCLRLASDSCSMYQYDLDFAAKKMADEINIGSAGIDIFMKKKFISMMKGTQIDYDEKRGGFVFNNPNVRQGE